VVTFDPPNDPEDEDEPNLEYDFDPASASDHYTRFPVRNPTRFLKSCIDHVRSLIWLPRREYGGGVISTGGPEVSLVSISRANRASHNLTRSPEVRKCQEDADRGVWMAQRFQK
jgi:hypothetical protein